MSQKSVDSLRRSLRSRVLLMAACAAAVTVASIEPACAQTAGTIANNVASQVSSIGSLIEKLIILGGVIVTGYSLWKWWGESKQQRPAGHFVFGMVIGVLMIAVPLVLGTGTQTIFGSNATGLSSIGVN
jgi:type IV secretory pathway VirB2 component (pilin)